MTISTKLNKGQAGGQALARKYGREHMQAVGRMGGRPRALTIEDIIPSTASAARSDRKENSHGESQSLEELRRLWRERQAVSGIIGGLGAACLFNNEKSSLEDNQHLGAGELDLPKNNPLPRPTVIISAPAPGRGGTR